MKRSRRTGRQAENCKGEGAPDYTHIEFAGCCFCVLVYFLSFTNLYVPCKIKKILTLLTDALTRQQSLTSDWRRRCICSFRCFPFQTALCLRFGGGCFHKSLWRFLWRYPVVSRRIACSIAGLPYGRFWVNL